MAPGDGDFASTSGFGDLIEKNGHHVTEDSWLRSE